MILGGYLMQHTKKMSWEDKDFLEQFREEQRRKATKDDEKKFEASRLSRKKWLSKQSSKKIKQDQARYYQTKKDKLKKG